MARREFTGEAPIGVPGDGLKAWVVLVLVIAVALISIWAGRSSINTDQKLSVEDCKKQTEAEVAAVKQSSDAAAAKHKADVRRLETENAALKNEKKTLTKSIAALRNSDSQTPASAEEKSGFKITKLKNGQPYQQDCSVGTGYSFWHKPVGDDRPHQYTVKVVGCETLGEGEIPCDIAKKHYQIDCTMTNYCNGERLREQYKAGDMVPICDRPPTPKT